MRVSSFSPFLVALFSLGLFLFASCPSDEVPPANVVLIIIDTLRADHCSAYGYERATTPNLDALAEKGVLFDRAWAQAPWTSPSMVSMFTGRYVLRNYTKVPGEIKTLPERFREAGFSTGALVANPVMHDGTGFERGFDHFEIAEKETSEGEMLETSLPANRFAPRATALLTQKLREPFFAWLHLFDPHMPYNAPERFARSLADVRGPSTEEYRSRQPDGAELVIEEQQKKQIDKIILQYDAEVAYADHALGKIVKALEAKGMMDRTLVIVTSDHGEGLFDHACYPDMRKKIPHRLFQGHVDHSYEEALHVPLVMAGPGLPQGVRYPGLVENLDLYKTCLAAGGIPADHGAKGMNLLEMKDKGKTLVYAFGTRDHSIRTDTGMKLIHPVQASFSEEETMKSYALAAQNAGHGPELFDLTRDPQERNNLREQETQLFQSLRQAIEKWKADHEKDLGQTDEISEEMKELLRGLGYAE